MVSVILFNLVLVCDITTANCLLFVVNIEYKNNMVHFSGTPRRKTIYI